MNKNNTAVSCVGIVTILVITLVVSSIAHGWALSLLWGWFVVPVFNAPLLSVAQAIGIGMIVTFLTRHSISADNKSKDVATVIVEAITQAILYPALSICFGYIVTLFL